MGDQKNDSVVQRRLHVLRLARKLGNVSEACRRCGVSRTRFYEWKRRYDAEGLAGLEDRTRHAASDRGGIPDSLVREILRLTFAHPAWGCDRLADYLKETGRPVSGVTIQKVRNRHGLGRRRDRRRALQEGRRRFGCRLTSEQLDFIHPRSRRRLGNRSGSGLFRYKGEFREALRVFRNTLEKTFGSHPFVFLFSLISAKHARELLAVAGRAST